MKKPIKMLDIEKKSVAFVANNNKTKFFLKIAMELIKNGVDVYWIVANINLYEYLLGFFGKNKILYVPNKNLREQGRIPFKYRDIILNDRTFCNNESGGEKYLRSFYFESSAFLSKNNVKYIFGELTWAHELLLFRMASNSLNKSIKYLNPHTIRIPNGRFAFFCDEFQSVFYEGYNSEVRNEKLFSLQKPDYLYLNDKLIAKRKSFIGLYSRLRSFLFGDWLTDKLDPTQDISKISLLRRAFLEYKNIIAYSKIVKSRDLSGKYIVYTLHKQPEASIDVLGRYYSDQKEIISNIYSVLPCGWKLFVKEHTNAIGDRDKAFYKYLLSMNDVVLIDEKLDSHDLIKNSQCVFTVSGTIAYEAALVGVPSFTFSECFFNLYPTCKKISYEFFRQVASIEAVIEESRLSFCESKNIDICDEVTRYSFPGIISDPISDIRCMSSENIEQVSRAFLHILKS